MHWLQQLTNGLALGSIYALIALGYTMVYGVLRFINFAHSDVLMLGAYSAFYLAPKMEAVFGPQSAVGTLFIIIAAAAICAVIGILIELLAYRPLRNRPKLTVLITAIGVSLFIEFTCQHRAVFGADTKAFPKLLPSRELHFAGIEMASNDLLVLVLTAVLLFAMWFIVQRTKMGMAIRAVSFNEKAAALMGVNVKSVFWTAKHVIPVMEQQGQGVFLITTSVAAFIGFPAHALYCASKGALESLIRCLAVDHAGKVRVVGICPGTIDTPMLAASCEGWDKPVAELYADVARRIPVRRLGQPIDIAQTAAFLLSDDASYINGTSIVLDGGTMGLPPW